MTIALVHGVPETSAIWGQLLDALHRRGLDDVVALSPPGFGAPLPEDWEPTMGQYTAWLVRELESLGGGVDVLGHDWGAAHVMGALAARPDLVRSWAVDVAGLVHPDYEWHDTAQSWQTPEVGEQVIAAMTTGTPDERAQFFASLGFDESTSLALGHGVDQAMGAAILTLYRSAVQPAMSDLGARLFAADRLPPGLVIDALDDPYAHTGLGSDVAGRLGASRIELDGGGHWWMSHATSVEQLADALAVHWAPAPT
ncbi:MAG: alpha/beta hydrolase [Ilumatobacteraceae bacterium]|nr:alpha/beta hydrolase [Ilumatobacteraceae bacterium]